jgi:hypothetical protein
MSHSVDLEFGGLKICKHPKRINVSPNIVILAEKLREKIGGCNTNFPWSVFSDLNIFNMVFITRFKFGGLNWKTEI